MRKLIISLAAAAAITAAAAPALAQPPHPCHAPARVAAIIWHPGGCGGCTTAPETQPGPVNQHRKDQLDGRLTAAAGMDPARRHVLNQRRHRHG